MAGTSRSRVLRVGAVAYDPKVVTIWEGFKEYFAARRVKIDYVLYSTYDAQVEANLCGEVDVAWNSPLAWVKSQIVSGGACRAVAMRDSDAQRFLSGQIPRWARLLNWRAKPSRLALRIRRKQH